MGLYYLNYRKTRTSRLLSRSKKTGFKMPLRFLTSLTTFKIQPRNTVSPLTYLMCKNDKYASFFENSAISLFIKYLGL